MKVAELQNPERKIHNLQSNTRVQAEIGLEIFLMGDCLEGKLFSSSVSAGTLY